MDARVAFVLFALQGIDQSVAQCGSDGGCKVNATTGVTCDYEFIPGTVYACGAGDAWSSDTRIENLGDDEVGICAEGYTVCGNDIDEMDDVEKIWGLTSAMCSPGPGCTDSPLSCATGEFYVAHGKSSDGVNCDDEGGDNVFGCGAFYGAPWYMGNGVDSNCGPFSTVLSNNASFVSGTESASDYGWYVESSDWDPAVSTNEFEQLRFNSNATKAKGGVMCCRKTMSDQCQSETTLDCAGCAEFAPCLNSVDPRCITQAALDCLSCEGSALCSPCAPGWDPGCMTSEWHKAEDAAYFAPDGTVTILNQTEYDGGKGCERCDQCDSYEEAVRIPFVFNEMPYFHPIFSVVIAGSCKNDCLSLDGCSINGAWIAGDYGMQPDIDFTNPAADWFSTLFNCSALNLTCEGWHSGDGPNPSDTYPDINVWDVNSPEGECIDTTFTSDCDWNENRTCSDKVAGECLAAGMYDEPKCPNAIHCGPAPCNTATEPACVHIEIFGESTTCDPVEGAGDYQAYVVADGVCNMDGSGRSYYQLGCDSPAAQEVSGVIGCTDSACSVGCTDIASMTDQTCYTSTEFPWLNDLTIAAFANVTGVCGPTTTTTAAPTTAAPTTAAPTTAAPVTAAPVTSASVTASSTSDSPIVNATDEVDVCGADGFSDMAVEGISGVTTACNFCFVFDDEPPRTDEVTCLRVGDEEADDLTTIQEECFLHYCDSLDCDDFAEVRLTSDALAGSLDDESCSCDAFECVELTTTEEPEDRSTAWRVTGARIVLGVMAVVGLVY